MVTRISCQPRPPFPPSSPLYRLLHLSVLRQLLMWPNKKLNVLASLAHSTRRQAISAHISCSLFFPFPSLSHSLCCPLSASLCGISSQADGGAPSPAQSQQQVATILCAKSCMQFICGHSHTHTHTCATHPHVQHTHTHTLTCEKQHSTHLISIIYDA